ncbi:hypothetical protein QTP88_007174 [Uroleucon formosanum]
MNAINKNNLKPGFLKLVITPSQYNSGIHAMIKLKPDIFFSNIHNARYSKLRKLPTSLTQIHETLKNMEFKTIKVRKVQQLSTDKNMQF